LLLGQPESRRLAAGDALAGYLATQSFSVKQQVAEEEKDRQLLDEFRNGEIRSWRPSPVLHYSHCTRFPKELPHGYRVWLRLAVPLLGAPSSDRSREKYQQKEKEVRDSYHPAM
jgi:hypothetical protein